MSAAPAEIDWARLDKVKFLYVGMAVFSGVTTVLYPLSVVKTQQMALASAPRGLRGAKATGAAILKAEGPRGLYRGFGTTILGLIPARIVYLTTLEAVKAGVTSSCEARDIGPAETAAIASSVGGGVASLTTQAIIVPVDVVTQRLMIAGSRGWGGTANARMDPGAMSLFHKKRINGLQMARKIVKAEGLRGMYRGFGLSVMTFVPSSALWWGCYGGYQKLLWQQLDDLLGGDGTSSGDILSRPTHQIVGVQTVAAAASGITTSLMTNPLDVIKTRLQVTESQKGALKPSFVSTTRELLASDGGRGLWRGVGPRVLSSILWGSTMVNSYEWLKRHCVLPDSGDPS